MSVFISTSGLRGQRFIFSARTRAAVAAKRAYTIEWPAHKLHQEVLGQPVQDRWDFTINRALEALTDGGAGNDEPDGGSKVK